MAEEALKPPIVADLMVTNVHTVSPEMTLDEAVSFLVDMNIPCAPVVEHGDEGNELLGLITEKDCLEYLSNELFYCNPDIKASRCARRRTATSL